MKVFIFGAGASKGSQDHYNYDHSQWSSSAPLVNELFQKKYYIYAQKRDPFRSPFLHDVEWEICANVTKQGQSIEEWLDSRWATIDSRVQESTKHAERTFFGNITFYLWHLFQAVSNTYKEGNGYRILLDRIRSNDEPFSLISFNYDTLLDRAIQSVFGFRFTSLEEYFQRNYLKPHGSVNWVLPYRQDLDPTFSGENQIDLEVRLRAAVTNIYNRGDHNWQHAKVFDPTHHDLNSFAAVISRFDSQYFFPLMFMPLSEKLYKYVPGFSERIIEAGASVIGDATEIYLIGYRATDELIKEIFKCARAAHPNPSHKTILHVVGTSSGSQDIMRSALMMSPSLEEGKIFTSGFMPFAAQYGL